MPCKHEGGTGPCVWYDDKNKNCKVLHAKYKRGTVSCANTKATPSDAGEAGELLVAADFLLRGLNATKPYNRNGADDLHVKAQGRWWTVQCKLGKVNSVTKTIMLNRSRRKDITSDIIALVDAVNRRIRYISNTNEPLPKELT